MKHNWMVTVVTETQEQKVLRVRAGNEEGARQKIVNEHKDVKVKEVRPDGP